MIGIAIANSLGLNFLRGIFGPYKSRVETDGGITEAGGCVDAGATPLLQTASLLLIPSGYKANKLYSEIPTNGNGDLTWTRTSTANRTNSSGLLQSMATGVPRLTYQNGGGGCPSLLLEKQSTNVILRSEEFDNASWVKTNATVTANSTTSPDGNSNADSLIENTASTQHFTSQQLTKSASSITYAFSVYYKNASGTRNIGVAVTNGTSSGKLAIFTSSGTITATDVTIGTGLGFSMTSSSVTNVGNGWYRASVIVSTDTATRVDAVIYLSDITSGVGAYTGNGTSGYFIYGAQLEASSYATSYIPTTSSSATRVADACYKTGISSLIGQSEGVLFCQFNKPVDTLASLRLNVSDGSFSNWVFVGFEATSLRAYLRANNTLIETQTFSTTANINKIAIAYKSGNYAIYHNGTQISSGTTVYSFSATLSQLNFGENPTDFNIYSIAQIAQFELFKTRLTNAELATLTTL